MVDRIAPGAGRWWSMADQVRSSSVLDVRIAAGIVEPGQPPSRAVTPIACMVERNGPCPPNRTKAVATADDRPSGNPVLLNLGKDRGATGVPKEQARMLRYRRLESGAMA